MQSHSSSRQLTNLSERRVRTCESASSGGVHAVRTGTWKVTALSWHAGSCANCWKSGTARFMSARLTSLTYGSSSGSTGRHSASRWWKRATCRSTRLLSRSTSRKRRHTCASMACARTGSRRTMSSSSSAGRSASVGVVAMVVVAIVLVAVASTDDSGGARRRRFWRLRGAPRPSGRPPPPRRGTPACAGAAAWTVRRRPPRAPGRRDAAYVRPAAHPPTPERRDGGRPRAGEGAGRRPLL